MALIAKQEATLISVAMEMSNELRRLVISTCVDTAKPEGGEGLAVQFPKLLAKCFPDFVQTVVKNTPGQTPESEPDLDYDSKFNDPKQSGSILKTSSSEEEPTEEMSKYEITEYLDIKIREKLPTLLALSKYKDEGGITRPELRKEINSDKQNKCKLLANQLAYWCIKNQGFLQDNGITLEEGRGGKFQKEDSKLIAVAD